MRVRFIRGSFWSQRLRQIPTVIWAVFQIGLFRYIVPKFLEETSSDLCPILCTRVPTVLPFDDHEMQ